MLADQFYLIAHEDRTGRSRLHPRATGLGLAAGLVGELLLLDRVRVNGGEVTVMSPDPPGDAVSTNSATNARAMSSCSIVPNGPGIRRPSQAA